MARRAMLAAIVALPCILLWWLLAARSSNIAALPPPGRGERPVRIVAFNAWIHNRAPDRAVRWISGQRPDILVLTEAAVNGLVIARALAPMLPHRVTCRSRNGVSPSCSTMILSRLPPVAAAGLARGDADNRRALSAAWAQFDSPQGRFSVVALHLSHPWPPALQPREVDLLARAMAGRRDARLVVAGDFNAPGWSATIRDIADQLSLRRLPDAAPTWPAPPAGIWLPTMLAIDHALVGPGWRAARLTRGPSIGSDHYPVVIDLVAGGARHGR